MPIYVYAVVDAAPRRRAPGLRFLRAGDLIAATRVVAHAPGVDEAALRAHDQTVRELCAVCAAVVPVRFGTVFHELETLRAALAGARRPLAKALRQVRGREQMTLRLLGKPARARRPKLPAGAGPGTRHLLARAQARPIAAPVPEADPLRARLGKLIRAERAERAALPARPVEGLSVVATLYHLVDRGQAEAYRAALAGAGETLAITGPHPPYAFAPEAFS